MQLIVSVVVEEGADIEVPKEAVSAIEFLITPTDSSSPVVVTDITLEGCFHFRKLHFKVPCS